MKALEDKYLEELEAVAGAIQASDELATYIESEELEDYKVLYETYEPAINELYEEVAAADPLQLIAFERILLHEAFEGLYLPRALGFSVLRGEITEDYKFTRPQEQFKVILSGICQSPNFDYLKRRIGQSVQVGFALSSDIWITGLINEQDNKKVRHFLKQQKLDRYRDLKERKAAYFRYERQFRNVNFQSTEFPATMAELKVLYPKLSHFMAYRATHDWDNTSIIAPINAFIENEALYDSKEYAHILGIYAGFFELDESSRNIVKKAFNKLRRDYADFNENFFGFLLDTYENNGDLQLDATVDNRYYELLDKDIKDNLLLHFEMMGILHAKGYVNEEVMNEVKNYLTRFQGLSNNSECLRQAVLRYVRQVMLNLDESEYAEFFEMNKVFTAYMQLFDNQTFSQNIKHLYIDYLGKLLKRYTDKRGRDYQDIKRFVSSHFVDLGFFSEKEVKETFKTRRKRKPSGE
jgi:hypothetical protein